MSIDQHTKGLPGLRGAEHLGFTVPNLEEASRFLVDVLGLEPYYERGPFESNDTWMQDALNVHPRAVMRKLRFFRCGNGTNFEVFEYESPDQRREEPKNSDVGGHHIGLYVTDIHKAVEHLRAHGVRVLGEPRQVASDAPNAGIWWVYFLAPWGMHFELVSFPEGSKPYERDMTRKLWNPCQPAL
ncbi:VOC family protein [Variovorax sp. J31P207]|uniref:VOC family protein n=1 Tax=Variovorax sp. J31P207 TaxID=3053510 RepID=UPI002578BBD8|nr:VOC family protein [Variovorax sp. J31P207]MDM0071551.1 VOC family protein [Variovorax sp. J31P207]